MSRAAFEALDELVALCGLEPPGAGQVAIAGDDPVLPVRYRIGAAGAASLAATGLAADTLWQMRQGGPGRQPVSVDLRAAVASLRSALYLRVDGKPPPPIWDAFSGIYQVRDGRSVSIHCNFANHREAARKVLGGPADRDAARNAALLWDGAALEDAIHAAGGCAGLIRAPEEWAAHPQSAAVAAQPLIEIARIGDAPPEPLPAAPREFGSDLQPLSGVRVLDLTRVLAGPTSARVLAEHGADVLKITAAHLPDSGQVDLDTGVGKLSAQIDLRTAEGTRTLQALVREADIFSQSYRPGALGARGFSPEALAKLRPGIVCATLSAWGTTGPWNARRGFDTIVQCVSGIAHASAVDGKPRYLPVSAIDYVTGYLMALGSMVALARRAREGGSWLVRVSLARTGQWIVDRGMLPQAALQGIADELPQDEITRLCMEVDAPDGRIRHLRPVVQMPESPPRWKRPPVPLGYHKPAWPPRAG